jgi:virginiamycin A acetyltransferase
MHTRLAMPARRPLSLVASLLNLVPLILHWATSVVAGPEAAWLLTSQRAARWTGHLGIFRRRALYQHLLSSSGADVAINVGALLTKRSIELGDHVYIGAYSIIGEARIGSDSLIGDHVCVLSGSAQHGTGRLDIPIRMQPQQYDVIRIGEDTWIGSHAVLMADVGAHCIVGAASVVTRPIPDYAIVVGNPARQIGDRRGLVVQQSES